MLKGFQNFTTLIKLAVILTMFPQEVKTVGVAQTDISSFSRVFFGVIFALILAGLIMLIVGSFINNKPINFFSSWRIIVYALAAGSITQVGSSWNNSYRGFGTSFYEIWYNRMFDGFWGASTYIKLFKPIKNIFDEEDTNNVNFINRVLIEILIVIVCRILAFTNKKVLKNLAESVILGLSIRIWVAGFWWFKQESVLKKENAMGAGWKRGVAGNWLGWIFCIISMLIVLEQAVMMFLRVFMNKEKKEDRRATYQEAEKTDRDTERVAETKFKQTPSKKLIS